MGYIIVYLVGLFVNFRKERQEAIDQEVRFPLKKFLLKWVIAGILFLSMYLLIDQRYYKIVDYAFNDPKEVAEIREKISGSWRFVHRKIYKETNGSHLLILDAKKVDNQNQKVKITRFWKYLAWYPNGFWPSVYELRYNDKSELGNLDKGYYIRTATSKDDYDFGVKVEFNSDTLKIARKGLKAGYQNEYVHNN
ncbi:MAG: hypothetical protein EOO86_08890 [Pedobacter sp.]|nr:MAG: hypothetical protein EOO86_08890 [Pedobacter sp.]